MSAVMLEPNHGHYDPRLIRRQYEGSSIEIGPDRVRWVPPTYRPFHRGGFTVPIGEQPGQVHAVARIRTAFPSRYGSGLIDRYVVSDAIGTVLGSFPSGQGISGSMLPEHLAGWYPAPAVQKAVEQAGLVWADRDFIGDAPALDAEFPGVVPHLRGLHRMAWMQSVVVVICGVAFLAMGVTSLVRGSSLPAVFFAFLVLLMVGIGAEGVFVGVLVSPPMMRYLRRRHLAGIARAS
jgi:hypothetical protein